jgi:hypothetical protein
MATTNFNSTISVVGPYGSNNVQSIVVTATSGTATHAVTAGAWNVSVGDTLTVTNAATGVTGYGTGTALVVAGITYSGGTAGAGRITFNTVATGTAGNSAITLTQSSVDADFIPSFGGNLTDSDTLTSVFKKFDGFRLNAADTITLFSYTEVSTLTLYPTILVTVDEINDVAGAAIANAGLCLQLADASAATAEVINLSTLRAGDSFYCSRLDMSYWEGNTGSNVTTPQLILRNPSGSTYYPVLKFSAGV